MDLDGRFHGPIGIQIEDLPHLFSTFLIISYVICLLNLYLLLSNFLGGELVFEHGIGKKVDN